MAVKLLNDVRSRLALDLEATDTYLRVETGTGAMFPPLDDDDDWFPVACEDAEGNIEFMRAIDRTGDIITVMRGQEGSLARDFKAGDACELRLTVAALREFGGGGDGGDGGDGDLPIITVSDATVSDA